jgi:hypothetical protein
MLLERGGTSADNAAIAQVRQAQRPGREEFRQKLRSRRVRRAEVALVSSYLRALRRPGEVPLTSPRPEMPN